MGSGEIIPNQKTHKRSCKLKNLAFRKVSKILNKKGNILKCTTVWLCVIYLFCGMSGHDGMGST